MRTQLISSSAECLSRYSDPEDPKYYGKYFLDSVSPRTGFQAICLYGAVLAASNGDIYLLDVIVQKLARRAYLQNYQGTWGLLQEFLEQTISAQEFEEKMFQSFSPNDIYGNILPRIANLLAFSIKVVPRDPSPDRPVRKTVRRRGYRDKGTLRTVESRARIAANTLIAQVEGSLRQDKRFDVKHPLLKKEAITNSEVYSLTTLSALEELHEAALEYLRKEEKLDDLQRRGLAEARTGVERIADITAAFIDELQRRIQDHQSPDLRTQDQKD